MSDEAKPSKISASGGMVAKVSVDGGPGRVLNSAFTFDLKDVARLQFGSQPAIESGDRSVQLFWYQALQSAELEQIWEERSSAVVVPLFKERGAAIQALGDGFYTCPRCTVEGWLPECRLCDGENAITLRQIEAWNDANPDEAWYVGGEDAGADMLPIKPDART